MKLKKYVIRPLAVMLAVVLLVQAQPLHGFVSTRAFVFPMTTLDSLPETPDMPSVVSRHVSELVELRTADSRHFRNEDGTFTAYVYSEIIHFQDADGNWVEIDNTLVRQGDFYTPRASGLNVQFPAVLGENGIHMHNGRHGFSLGVPGANSEAIVPDLMLMQWAMMAELMEALDFENMPSFDAGTPSMTGLEELPAQWHNQEMATARNLQSMVYYFDVWPGAHLEYILSADGLKENIIVPEPKEQYVYDFTLNLYGLDAVQHNERTIVLYCDFDGTPQMVIEAPFARDAAGVENTRALTISLDGNTLTLTADAAWMNAPTREFPVVLDPTYLFVADLDRIIQVRVNNQRGTNFGWQGLFNPNMFVGSNADMVSRGYIRFQMPQMPQNAAVVHASMMLDDNSSPWWVRMVNGLIPFLTRAISLFMPSISLEGLVDFPTNIFDIPFLGWVLRQVFGSWIGNSDGADIFQIPLGQILGDLPRLVWHAIMGGLSHLDPVNEALERGYTVNIRAERVIEDWSGARYGRRAMDWEHQPNTTGVALSLGEIVEQEANEWYIDALRGLLGRGVPLTGLYSFDITEAVQHWERFGENYGIRLMADNEDLTEQNMLEFAMPAHIAFMTAGRVIDTAAWLARVILPFFTTPAVSEAIYYTLMMIAPVTAIPNAINAMEADPFISIVYICTTGLQPFFSYETVSMGRAGTAHINHQSGGLTVTHPTLQLDGERMPVGLSHVYSSNHDQSPGQIWGMNLGVGMRMNVMEKITPPYYFTPVNMRQGIDELYRRIMSQVRPDFYEGDDTTWLHDLEEFMEQLLGEQRLYRMFVDGTGGMHRFVQCDDNPLVLRKQTNSDITMSYNGLGQLEISDEFGNRRIFRSAYIDTTGWVDNLLAGQLHRFRHYYYLMAIRDANGNETNIFYNGQGRINSIVDTVGRTIDFIWNSRGYLESITCPMGRVTTFHYDTETFGDDDDPVSVLSHIEYYDGAITYFHYKQFGNSNPDAFNRVRLAALTNSDEHTFAFELEQLEHWARTNYRVTSIMHGVGVTVNNADPTAVPSTGQNNWMRFFFGTAGNRNIVQRLLYFMNTVFAWLWQTALTIFREPSWVDVDDYGWWHIGTGDRPIPVYGDRAIMLEIDWEKGELISTTTLHFGQNSPNAAGNGQFDGNMTTVVNSLGEPEGVTYIFDRMGRAVGARDNAEDTHAFVLFTVSEGMQNLPGFMAGAAIVENLFNPTGWIGGAPHAGNNSRIAWQVLDTARDGLHQTVIGLPHGTVENPNQFTVSFYAMAENTATTARLYIGDNGYDLDVTNRWERHSVTFCETDVSINSVSFELHANGGEILVEGLQLEQNAGTSPFNHVANSHFARGEADWQIAERGMNDGYTHEDESVGLLARAWNWLTSLADDEEDCSCVGMSMHGDPNATKVLWQPVYLGLNAAGQMLLFGATAEMHATRSEPFYTRVAVRFFNRYGQLIELETEYDCDEDNCDHADCDPVGFVRENQVFAPFNRDVRGVQQTAAMAHLIPDDAVRANLYIVYHEQASGCANAIRVHNAFAYIGAGGSTMSYLGGRVSEVRSSSGTMVYTWQADGPNVQSIEIIRPGNREELEENDRIDFEYDAQHNITRIIERRAIDNDDEGRNLITKTYFEYHSGNAIRYTSEWAPRWNHLLGRGPLRQDNARVTGILTGSTVLTFIGTREDEESNDWDAAGDILASYQNVTYVNNYGNGITGNFFNDVREVSDSNGGWIRYYYDSFARNIVTQVRTSDGTPEGALFVYGYNQFDAPADGQGHAFDVLNVIEAFGGYNEGEAIWFTNRYDFTGMGDTATNTLTGLLHSIERANGTTYTLQHNQLGQVERVYVGEQLMVENTYFEEENRLLNQRRFALASRNYANGFRFEPLYDQRGRVIGERWGRWIEEDEEKIPVGMTTTTGFTFADNGTLSRVLDNTLRREINFMYDTRGRLTSLHTQSTVPEAAVRDSRVRLGFNDDGALDMLRVSLNGREISRVSYAYDVFERPETASFMGTQLRYYYDEDTGRLERTSLLGGRVQTIFGFNDRENETITVNGEERTVTLAGDLTRISHALPGRGLIFDYTYRDGSGNIETITQTWHDGENATSVRTNTFTYDRIGQLVRDYSSGRDSRYFYDDGGNMTEWRLNDVVQMQFHYDNEDWPDQLTSVTPGGVITYDAMGNMTSFNGRVFEWQRGRQLASIHEDGLDVYFTYDHTGLRSSKTVNGVTSYYIWAGNLLVARYTPLRNETLAWFYDIDGSMLGFALTIGDETSHYFYIRNIQGDVVAILDEHGIIVAEYVYDAWGNLLYVTDSHIAEINPIRYRGYYWDDETQLYYLQSRYYCPSLRRFISADVFMDTGQQPLGTNMYMYCLNDPINLIDPEGTRAIAPPAAGTWDNITEQRSSPLNFILKPIAKWILRAAGVTGALTYTLDTVVPSQDSVQQNTATQAQQAATASERAQAAERNIAQTLQDNPEQRYWAAHRNARGNVVLDGPISDLEAIQRVRSGQDVFARSEVDARMLARTSAGLGMNRRYWPHEAHPNRGDRVNTQFSHFHVSRFRNLTTATGAHIYFM